VDLHIETDQESWDLNTLLLALGNGPREGGGFLVTPEAKYDDGILRYVTIRKISRLFMLRLVPEVMKGTHGRFKVVKMGTCRKMSVHSRQPLYVHLDGEVYAGFGTDIRQLAIDILPGAIQFMRE
jgi:diacylglycerol kinase family enzyme